VCEQLAQGCYLEVDQPGFEPATFWIASICFTVMPYRPLCIVNCKGELCTKEHYNNLIGSLVSLCFVFILVKLLNCFQPPFCSQFTFCLLAGSKVQNRRTLLEQSFNSCLLLPRKLLLTAPSVFRLAI